MGRELYLYWRTSPADMRAASAATRSFQHRQMLAAPGLQARLLQRADAAGGGVTLMEIYALPAGGQGIDDALQRRIVDEGDAATAPWRTGARHVEIFSEIDLAEDRSPNSGPG